MKKMTGILLSLMILVSLSLLIYLREFPLMKVDGSLNPIMKMNYNISGQAFPTSVSVYDSDYSSNLILMEQIIGTLVKYGNSGYPEAYLAKQWKFIMSENSWVFTLHKNLVTEDGEEINATNYIKSFLLVFKKLIDKSDPPVFKNLVGYKLFKEGQRDLEGLQAIDDYTIKFQFTKKVSGLLEFLSMPYYGFYSLKNFSAGDWKSKKNILSSGAYTIKSWTSDKVLLEKRQDWILNTPTTPRIIEISKQEKEFIEAPNNPTIVLNNATSIKTNKFHQNFYDFEGVPTFLMSIILSTEKTPIFRNLKVRKYIQTQLSIKSASVKLDTLNGIKTNTFYHTNDYPFVVKNNNKIPVELMQEEINLVVATTEPDDSEFYIYISTLLKKVFENSHVKLQWLHVDKSKPDWISKMVSNKDYDIRIAHVNSGSYPINWAVSMMFCSRLGVSFPDFSGRICKLAKDYETQPITNEDYLLKFEQIVYEDAVVIPLAHRLIRWKVSNDIDSTSLDPTSGVIRFDLVRTK